MNLYQGQTTGGIDPENSMYSRYRWVTQSRAVRLSQRKSQTQVNGHIGDNCGLLTTVTVLLLVAEPPSTSTTVASQRMTSSGDEI